MMTVAVRKYIYMVLLAAFPVAAIYYPPIAPAAPLWLALGMALLNLKPEDIEAEPVFGKAVPEQEPDWDDDET